MVKFLKKQEPMIGIALLILTGSAVGTVSTSSTPTIGNLAYWTSTAYPSLLGTVATSTIGAGTGLTFSGTSRLKSAGQWNLQRQYFSKHSYTFQFNLMGS